MNKKRFNEKVLLYVHIKNMNFIFKTLYFKNCFITFLWYCFWDQILFVNKEFNFFIENFCSKRKRIVNFFNYTETRSHLHVYQAIFVINITFLNLNNRGILKESFFRDSFLFTLIFLFTNNYVFSPSCFNYFRASNFYGSS